MKKISTKVALAVVCWAVVAAQAVAQMVGGVNYKIVSKTDKTELVTNGIYQISRNPAFLGFDLLYIGTLLMFFNWILCFLTVFAVIMYHLQIVNVEEDFLFATFGNEYLQYKKKVCRYIGRKR